MSLEDLLFPKRRKSLKRMLTSFRVPNHWPKCLKMALLGPQKMQQFQGLSGPVLRDTARLSQRYPPSLRAMGFSVSQHGQMGAIPPLPLFGAFPPLESIRQVQVRYPPLRRGISAILARYPMKTRQMGGAIPPSAILSRKGIAR